jgi:hypothetical protein
MGSMASRISFVVCVESGVLESMTVRAVESLRLFGGRFAESPVFAVTPRPGWRLNKWTTRRFRELGVEHVRLASPRRFSWYHYLNKPVALATAESVAQTELVAFLDSDTVVLQEPEALDLEAGVDFAASVSDVELGATTGPGHPNEAAWEEICVLVGLVPDDLPWVRTWLDEARVRLYFNSGVLVYRRSQKLGARQLKVLTRVFNAGIELPGSASRMVEQVVLAPLVVSDGVPWTALPFSHNSTMISLLDYKAEHLRDARILHYHDSMSPDHWPQFLERIETERPEAASWLREVGPIASPATPLARAAGEGLRIARGALRRASAMRRPPP